MVTDRRNRNMVWSALSELYLDTELDYTDYKRIGEIIAEAKYSKEKARVIDYYEVMPTVGLNLMSSAGVWSDVDSDWLHQRCYENSQRNGLGFKAKCYLLSIVLKKSRRKSWRNLDQVIKKALIANNQGS